MEIHWEANNSAQAILVLTDSLIKKCGLRPPGSAGSAKAAEEIAQFMRGFCDEVSTEAFVMHPGSLFSIGRVISVAYLLAVILLFFGLSLRIYFSLAMCLLAFACALIQYFLYGRLFDPLFRKRIGVNT